MFSHCRSHRSGGALPCDPVAHRLEVDGRPHDHGAARRNRCEDGREARSCQIERLTRKIAVQERGDRTVIHAVARLPAGDAPHKARVRVAPTDDVAVGARDKRCRVAIDLLRKREIGDVDVFKLKEHGETGHFAAVVKGGQLTDQGSLDERLSRQNRRLHGGLRSPDGGRKRRAPIGVAARGARGGFLGGVSIEQQRDAMRRNRPERNEENGDNAGHYLNAHKMAKPMFHKIGRML